MTAPALVVFDCNVLLQSMLSAPGPAGMCLALVEARRVRPVLSAFVIAEVRALPTHPDLKRFPSLTPERVEAFLSHLLARSTLISPVPEVFTMDRDPADAHYVNLALAAGATLIVSRDNDLLALADAARPEGREFRARFPSLRILRPHEFLLTVGPTGQAGSP
ncbi:MAG TPA: putative toxin-antitoxin system toxin component, PIN family [Phycisphaerales bacterium]|nr:putative toxin-antitoxin system toxin component, PIN family [Phycisphaerales bacterium]